jgi:predicted enzyme related to lactoylglutathione lyase
MSAVHWFEVPVRDIKRASQFYQKVMAVDIQVVDLREQQGSQVGMFPGRGGVSGALVQNDQYGYVPSKEGSLVYLELDGDLNEALARVVPAGGQVLLPKTSLGDDSGGGFTAWISDTEGNRVGLFSST